MATDGIEVTSAQTIIECLQDGTTTLVNAGDTVIEIINGGSVTITGGGLSDGDKGDIIVSGDGANLAINPNVLTAFGRSLADDEDAATARATLGLGSAATQSAAAFEAAGSSATAIAAHIAAADPHPGYMTPAEADATFAPLASPTFTGTPAAPTAGAGTNTTQIATTAFVAAAIAALANSAPATLDTLNELAAALSNDPNFATTITNALAGKAPTVHSHPVADLSDATAAGRAMVLAADPAAQTALLDAFTTALKGLVPPPVTVAGKFLKDDGTWDTPAGGSGTPEVYVQQTRPSATGPWLWWETDVSGLIVDLTVNDGT